MEWLFVAFIAVLAFLMFMTGQIRFGKMVGKIVKALVVTGLLAVVLAWIFD